MSREPLNLDIRSKPRGLDTSDFNLKQGNAQVRTPLQGDVERFQQKMNAPQADTNQLPSGPFALFGNSAVADKHTGPTDAAGPVHEVLNSVVKRLLVSDGREGRRSARIGLTDEVMPGVEVEVFQELGAWVASFECRDLRSFEQLAQPAEQMAQELAKALESNATWLVKPANNLPEVAHLSTVEARAYWGNAGGGA